MKNDLKIIAEIAQGFEGNFTQSKLLINAAAKSGADYVKFQLVYAKELSTTDYKYFKLFKNLEMEESKWKELKEYAISLGIKLIFDVFGVMGLKTAENIGIETVKVHGTDITNLALLRDIEMSKINKVILGIGGAQWYEIEKAIKLLKSKSLILLCGFQGYPTKTEDNHIARMNLIKEKAKKIHSDFEMGFADHPSDSNLNSKISLVAIGAGAMIIEKHLTLGKVMQLEDFESALNPDEFKDFVNDMKDGKNALGESMNKDDFGMSDAEKKYRENIRRDVVAQIEISEGELINEKNTTLKRTSAKKTIKQLDLVIGKKAKKGIKKNQPILKKDIY